MTKPSSIAGVYFSMLKSALLIVLCVLSPFAMAENSSAQQLQRFLDNTQSLSAQFEQTLLNEYNELMQQSAGELRMQRPGKFRWDYTKPYEQNIVSNGRKIWMYDAELEQVSVRPYEQLESSPVNLLDNQQPLDTLFTLQDMPAQEGQDWVKLIPLKADSDFQQMLVGLHKGSIKTMRLLDNFNQQTEIIFTDITINPSFKSGLFEFSAPAGADIMGDF